MILRALIFLWAVTLALPAAAMPCHAPPVAPVAHPDHHGTTPAHHAPAGRHDGIVAGDPCPGCIPPGMWRGAAIAAPTLFADLPRRIARARIDRLDPNPPALPPPRLG